MKLAIAIVLFAIVLPSNSQTFQAARFTCCLRKGQALQTAQNCCLVMRFIEAEPVLLCSWLGCRCRRCVSSLPSNQSPWTRRHSPRRASRQLVGIGDRYRRRLETVMAGRYPITLS